MLIIVRLTAGWGRWLWLAGAIAIAAKPLAAVAHSHWPELEFLNAPAWNWLGLISRKPITEDYVPLSLAGCHVVGHGGRAVAAGAPAGDGAASRSRAPLRRWRGWGAGA